MTSETFGTWVHVDPANAAGGSTQWDVGNGQPLWMRHERIELSRDVCEIRLLYASDLHLGGRRSVRVVNELIRAAALGAPRLILLGGDLVDSGPGLRLLESCVNSLSAVAPVCGVAGNHDRVIGEARVERALEAGGGRWIQDRSFELQIADNRRVYVDGTVQQATDRATARILCGHDPAVFPAAVRAGYRLVLAGHLHGSQCVLSERDGMLYPGAWFFRWNGLRFAQDGCHMLVSRGMADTLPLRWNCRREVLLCEIA